MSPATPVPLVEERTIEFPFVPYGYQREALDALKTKKRAALVWHRRSGKDLTLLNYMVTQAIQRPGLYFYLFPTYSQGKKIFWLGMNNEGMPYRHYIPKELVVDQNEAEMRITLRTLNGMQSIIQVIGTDNINSIVGTNPIGAIHTEYSLHNPRAKSLLEPIFAANGGWQVFAYTPRGRNHGWKLYQAALQNPDKWYASLRGIDQTCRADGSPIITAQYLTDLITEGEDEDIIQQEYYCSFEGWVQGSYYGRYLRDLRAAGRICPVPFDPRYRVRTSWDIGVNDTNAILIYQKCGLEYRIIDHIEASGYGAEYYVQELAAKPYLKNYDLHILPWDVGHEEWGSGKTRLSMLSELFGQYFPAHGRHIRTAAKLHVNDGISAVRRLFPRLKFDAEKCDDALGALAFYHKEWDEDRQTFKNNPDHDWSSNTADALRTLALGEHDESERQQTKADSSGDILSLSHEAEYDDPYAPARGEQELEWVR